MEHACVGNNQRFAILSQKVVVLVGSQKKEIQKEIDERITDTIRRENNALWAQSGKRGIGKYFSFLREKLHNNLTVIVREGDIYSSKQLHDISIERARSVVILGNDVRNTVCQYGKSESLEEMEKGNAQTVKTLMQVSDITSADYSLDHQKIIVEISDDWTWELVQRIIGYKQVAGKCNIVPVRVNQVLGQILSQFSLMPELNLIYKELFSNKGTTFYVEEKSVSDENAYITQYLANHIESIPLTTLSSGQKNYFVYASGNEKNIRKTCEIADSDYSVKLNRNYWIEKKTIIILGHNSKIRDIMKGFGAFHDEWNYKDGSDDILNIIVIDDEKSLEKMNFYKEYSFVTETVAASVYDEAIICGTIERIVDSNEDDTSILILSDDSALAENIDANALANLVYVQDIINSKKKSNSNFDEESIDVIVEILDPKHHDIVSSYSVNNVVISNRYISKMITQIGEKEAIFDFYNDILTYDSATDDAYESKEVYTKKVSTFFDELPEECTEGELIRSVWKASVDPSIPPEKQNPTVVLGYVKKGGAITLFDGNQSCRKVKLQKDDKIIVFTNH